MLEPLVDGEQPAVRWHRPGHRQPRYPGQRPIWSTPDPRPAGPLFLDAFDLRGLSIRGVPFVSEPLLVR